MAAWVFVGHKTGGATATGADVQLMGKEGMAWPSWTRTTNIRQHAHAMSESAAHAESSFAFQGRPWNGQQVSEGQYSLAILIR